MGIYGQDWSSYQGVNRSADGLAFVFLKVTEGLTYENPVWKQQYKEVISAGAVAGFYHYPHMHNNPDAEVNYFLSKVKPKTGEMVVLDWEGYDANNRNISPSEQLAYKEEYIRYMRSKCPDNPVGLYCNTDYWLRIDRASHAGDFLWIATANKPAGHPGIDYAWKFHQYSASGVDKDYGNFSDKSVLRAWVNGFSSTHTPTEPPHIKVVHLPFIQKAAKVDSGKPQGHTSYPVEVRIVEDALLAEKLLELKYATDGYYGTKTKEAYAKWQEHLNYSGKDADGIPGLDSLRALGKKHGFAVVL